MKHKILFTFVLLATITLSAQEVKLSDIITGIAEELAEDESDPEAASSYIEKLNDLSLEPVRLNSADEDEVARLFFLSGFQIKALLDYSRSSGKIMSPFEIANIPGFDKETAIMMIPFITLEDKSGINTDHRKLHHTSLTNISFRTGVDDTSMQGSPVKVLSKYKFSSGGFSGGITLEKDAGEKFLTGHPPLPDFLSSHLAFSGNGFIRKIVIGDFSARFGQGLNVNTGIGTGLSLSSPGYMAARNEIRQYTSTDENNFFRGVGGEFLIKDFSVILYYSRNSTDATLGNSSSPDEIIETFYPSGLHTTPSQILKKDAVIDRSYGVNLSYNFRNLRFGVIWSEDKLSLPVRLPDNDPEKIYDFSGDRNNLFSAYYNCVIKKILLYGEISMNEPHRYALVQGMSMRLSDRLTVNGLFRKYNPGYFSFHGRGPGGSSSEWNESSFLGNFTFEAARHLFISAGSEIRKYPWLKYRSSSPSDAIRHEIRARYLPAGDISFEAVFNFRAYNEDSVGNSGIPIQNTIKTSYIKGTMKYSPGENITLGTRIDYKSVEPSGSRGMLLLQDVSVRLRKIPVTIWLRYCLFNSDDWDSRLYTYENDLLYNFSIPALAGEGSRSYFMIKWELGDFADMRFKYGITSVSGQDNKIENKEEFKFQIKMNF